MTMKADLKSRIDALTVVQNEAARVSWHERPKTANAFPAIVLTLVSSGQDYSHNGPLIMQEPRVQVDVWALESEQAERLASAIKAEMELDGVTGNLRDVGGTRFHNATLEYTRTWAPEDMANGTRAYREQQDFTFFHEPI